MSRRRTYPGYYAHGYRPSSRSNHNSKLKEIQKLYKMMLQYIGTVFSVMNVNYMALATVFVVVILSYLIPDVSQKVHANSELKDVKKIVNVMTAEVNRAQAACLTATGEVCRLRCSVQDDTTETLNNDYPVCVSRCMHSTRSEPAQNEQKIGFFRNIFSPNKNASHKEITIMSYVYTDSFDGGINSASNATSRVS